jgi:enoyl-CoA hydratase
MVYNPHNPLEYRHITYKPEEYKRIVYMPGKVTRIILNRPRYLNALSAPMYGELEDAFDRASADPNCHVIVVSGAGSCFSTGHDAIGLTPESAPTLVDGRTPEELMKDCGGSETEVWRLYNNQHHYYMVEFYRRKLINIPRPTIAMVHGYCTYAGWLLAGAMDLIFASEDALFMGEGLFLGPNTWDMRPRKLLEVWFEHRMMTARELYEMGVVSRIYPTREILEKETLAYADRVADNLIPSRGQALKQGIYHLRDILGFPRAEEDLYTLQAANRTRTPREQRQHAERYEGRGMMRAPRAMRNLKLKLESEGTPVPKLVLEALARAESRDDRAKWDKALHQEWRDPERIARAEAEAKARAQKEKKKP